MGELATQWNSFVRDYRDKLDFNKSKSRKAKTDNELLLKQNPPEDMEGFIQQFSKIPHSEEFDTRVVAFIAGIPDHED